MSYDSDALYECPICEAVYAPNAGPHVCPYCESCGAEFSDPRVDRVGETNLCKECAWLEDGTGREDVPFDYDPLHDGGGESPSYLDQMRDAGRMRDGGLRSWE